MAGKKHTGTGATLFPSQDGATHVIRDGHGSDTLAGFVPAKDIIAFDMSEIASYGDVTRRMDTDGRNVIITFDRGDRLTVQDVVPGDLSPANFTYANGPTCFLKGSPLLTERGEIAIEELRPDDIIWTKDHGWQAFRLIVRETVKFGSRDDPAKPILIPANALGAGQPAHDLIVSPQNRVLQIGPGGQEILVPAIDLVGKQGIRPMRGRKRAEYLNVVMERHSIIQAAGCWVESMLVTSRSLSRQDKAARQLMAQLHDMTPARRIEKKGVRSRRLRPAS